MDVSIFPFFVGICFSKDYPPGSVGPISLSTLFQGFVFCSLGRKKRSLFEIHCRKKRMTMEEEIPMQRRVKKQRTTFPYRHPKVIKKKMKSIKRRSKKPVKVRTEFPETWLWIDERIGLV